MLFGELIFLFRLMLPDVTNDDDALVELHPYERCKCGVC